MNNSSEKVYSKKSIWKSIWNLLISMKFAIVLLIILGTASLLSMLMNEYPDFFGKASFFYKLIQQHSPYSSWWYSVLLGLLIVSILSCVLKNIVPVVKTLTHFNFKTINQIKLTKNYHQIKIKDKNGYSKVKSVLKKHHYRIKERVDGQEKLISASKFKISRLGSIITHIGILIIVIGGIIYTMTTREEFKYLVAEEHQRGKIFSEYPDFFSWRIHISENEVITVTVDSFRVRYYNAGKGPRISDFRSYVKVFDINGKKIRNHEITVNNPLVYKQCTIHQSDYKPLVEEFFRNIPNRRNLLKTIKTKQEIGKNEKNWLTGLSLRISKGKAMIFTGMVAGFLGLIISFLFWRRDIWVVFEGKYVFLTGKPSKNKIAFNRELGKIIGSISK